MKRATQVESPFSLLFALASINAYELPPDGRRVGAATGVEGTGSGVGVTLGDALEVAADLAPDEDTVKLVAV